MITPLGITVPSDVFNSMLNEMPNIDFKLTLNEPTGNFFYDPWTISDKFKGTIWEKVLSTLPHTIGEARLISLPKKECYMAHADIDNRWHLPIITGKSFLVDLENNVMHKLVPGSWYYMDAGRDHSAVNFGEADRVQLVIRELLVRGKLINPKTITIRPCKNLGHIRYVFDNIYSPWLNKINLAGLMDNFKIIGDCVTLDIDSSVEVPQHEAFEIV